MLIEPEVTLISPSTLALVACKLPSRSTLNGAVVQLSLDVAPAAKTQFPVLTPGGAINVYLLLFNPVN